MKENNQNLKNKFIRIEEALREDLIGQDLFIDKLCKFFKDKIEKKEKGILFLSGEKDTGKYTSIKVIFETMENLNLIESSVVDEINLASYNFNLGYNAFLTDLYEKLNNSSECLIFKNTDQASTEILNILSQLYPNTCLLLNNDYVLKNKILISADVNNNDKKINNMICHNKFLVLTSSNEDIDVERILGKEFTSKCTFIETRPLNKKYRNIIIKKEILKSIKEIQNKLDIDIVLEIKEDDKSEEYFGICKFLQESYKKDSNFGISEYISYKLLKPIQNLVRDEQVESGSNLIVYVENEEIYCKVNSEIFLLSNYITPTLDEVKYKLKSIIGMEELKEFIQNIKNNYRVQEIRERLGLKTSKISLNMIFAGNAGTGKTNAARITFEYLNALGILSKGTYKEVSKADFLSENPNDTAKRTNDILTSARGGVLFIDEAYSLCESENDKIGKEIVDALLKGIEDNRDELVVIMAGYENDMEKFLSINPGLKSRFPNTIHFRDYSPSQMYEIAVNIAKSKGYKIAKNVKNDLIELFTKNQIIGKNDLGNARFVRNIIENAIMDASKKYLTNKNKQIDLLERDNFNFKASTKFDLEARLSQIIGLSDVKKLLRSQYKLIIAQEKRKAAGVSTQIEQNLNMVFAGNPGTGKTSIARLVAEMLNSMGLLKVGQLVETDRSSFVSEIRGETPKKTEEKFKEAIGGILFIDEAYTLANDDLGREAIETLLKLIEDYSKEVIVILAGYEEEMEDFFDVNIGLRSRFPLWTVFEDYNPNELYEMSIKLIEAKGFKLSKNAYISLKKSFVDIYESADSQSGNGRMVRNYVEHLIRNQSIRIAESDISVYEMNLITTKDIENINVSEYENDFDIEKNLKVLVGNEEAKEFIRNQYKLLKIKEKRKKLGMRIDINKYMNMVFVGKVGTGKKKFLNILGQMYYSMGIVKAKNIIEIDKNEIVSMLNKGLTIDDIFNKYIGKILLIDKADLFVEDESCLEISSSIIKFIDKNKDSIIIVLSGEKEELKKLLSNESLNYRFPLWVEFRDYNYKELFNIAINILKSKSFILDNDAEIELTRSIEEIYECKYMSLKNALLVKGYLNELLRYQSSRVYNEKVSNKDINVIKAKDILFSKNEFINKNIKINKI